MNGRSMSRDYKQKNQTAGSLFICLSVRPGGCLLVVIPSNIFCVDPYVGLRGLRWPKTYGCAPTNFYSHGGHGRLFMPQIGFLAPQLTETDRPGFEFCRD